MRWVVLLSVLCLFGSAINAEPPRVPSPTDPWGFCSSVIAQFSKQQKDLKPEWEVALKPLIERLNAAQSHPGPILDSLDPLVQDALQEIVREIQSGRLDVSLAVHVGFRDLRAQLQNLIVAHEAERMRLYKMGVRAHTVLILDSRINQVKALEKKLQSLSPQEISEIFVRELGFGGAADSVPEHEPSRSFDVLRYHQLVRDMIAELHEKLQRRGFSKHRSVMVALTRDRLFKEDLSARSEDIVVIGDLFREDLISRSWAAPKSEVFRAAREALTRFFTAETMVELDAQGHLPPVSAKQIRFHEMVTRRATHGDYVALDHVYFSSGSEFRENVQQLRLAFMAHDSDSALPLDPGPDGRKRVVENHEQLALVFVRLMRAARLVGKDRDLAARVLSQWLFEGYGSQLSKADRHHLQSRVLLTIPVAQQVADRLGRSKFYKNVGKSLGVLIVGSALISGGMGLSHELGIAPSWFSWKSQWSFLTENWGWGMKWFDLQMDEVENLFIKKADTLGKNL